jgi:hypothetical protein
MPVPFECEHIRGLAPLAHVVDKPTSHHVTCLQVVDELRGMIPEDERYPTNRLLWLVTTLDYWTMRAVPAEISDAICWKMVVRLAGFGSG